MTETFVPFSVRYGIHDDVRFADHKGRDRHLASSSPADTRLGCDCLGTSHVQCSARLDREDTLCTECRDWCWGITPTGERVSLERLTSSGEAAS